MFGKVQLVIGGLMLVALVCGGFYIRALRADNALLQQQRDTAVRANKALVETLEMTTRANEEADRVNEGLRQRLEAAEALYDEARRQIDATSGAMPVDPVVRDTLRRMWSK